MPKIPPKVFPKPPKVIRTERLNLRLTPDELAKVTAKASEVNLPVATYLRDRILELSPPIVRVKDLPTIDPQLMRLITGAFNNLNQLTKIANSQIGAYGRADSTTLQLSIDRLAHEIEQLRQQYTVK